MTGAGSRVKSMGSLLRRINARSRSCAQSTVGTLEKRRDVTPTGLLHGRSLSLLQKWRDVEEPPGVVLVQAEEMSAVRTPVAPEQVRTFAHQMEDTLLPARWALLDVHVGQVLGLGIRRLPHGACQPSRKRFAPSLGRRGRMCGRSRVKRSLSSALRQRTDRQESQPRTRAGLLLRLRRIPQPRPDRVLQLHRDPHDRRQRHRH